MPIMKMEHSYLFKKLPQVPFIQSLVEWAVVVNAADSEWKLLFEGAVVLVQEYFYLKFYCLCLLFVLHTTIQLVYRTTGNKCCTRERNVNNSIVFSKVSWNGSRHSVDDLMAFSEIKKINIFPIPQMKE